MGTLWFETLDWAVISAVQRQRDGQSQGPEAIAQTVRAAMWFPEYPAYA